MLTPFRLTLASLDDVAANGGKVPIVLGGTNATTAAGARTALGLSIGTDVLAPAGSGAALTALNASALASGTVSAARLPALATSVDGRTGAVTLGDLYQPITANLTAIAAIAPTKGRLLVGDGSAWQPIGVGSNAQVLTADSVQALGIKWAAASGAPGGSTNQVQYNSAGAFAGSANLTFDGTTLGANSLASLAGNPLAAVATSPVQIMAAQAGSAVTVTAGSAVAGSSTAGAAAGGSVTVTAGAAARLTSGNAAGGDVVLTPGAGIGTGAAGTAIVRQPGGTPGTSEIQLSHGGAHGVIESKNGQLRIRSATGFTSIETAAGSAGNAYIGRIYGNATLSFLLDDYAASISMSSNWTILWTSGSNYAFSRDLGISRTAPKVLGVTDGASGAGWLQNTAGRAVTTADVTNATTTPANLSGLSITVTAGRKYTFRATLYVANSVAADGLSLDWNGGTATMTAFRAHTRISDTAPLLSTQSTALATAAAVGTVTGDAIIEVQGSLTVNTSGTLIPRFAENSHTTGTLTVYRGSHVWVEDMP